jgi:hypothetical protein
MLLVCLPAVLLSTFYLLLAGFTTLRFLIPVFALLSLPVAMALISVTMSPRARRKAAVVVATALAAHVGLMLLKAERELDESGAQRAVPIQLATALRPLVDGHPCLLVSRAPQATAFYLGCDAQYPGSSKRPPKRVSGARAEGHLVVAVLRSPPPPGSYLASWRLVPLDGLPRGLEAYIPPD